VSFITYRDSRGNLKVVDAALTKATRLQCPKCGIDNPFVLYMFEDRDGGVERRYYYVCPDCKIHYTNWGPNYDYRGRHRITKAL
jgi:transposase-like protein